MLCSWHPAWCHLSSSSYQARLSMCYIFWTIDQFCCLSYFQKVWQSKTRFILLLFIFQEFRPTQLFGSADYCKTIQFYRIAFFAYESRVISGYTTSFLLSTNSVFKKSWFVFLSTSEVVTMELGTFVHDASTNLGVTATSVMRHYHDALHDHKSCALFRISTSSHIVTHSNACPTSSSCQRSYWKSLSSL